MIIGFAVKQDQIGQLAITNVVKGMVPFQFVDGNVPRDGTNGMAYLCYSGSSY